QVEGRQSVGEAQQIARDDLARLQAQALAVYDAQAKQALAYGLAAPIPFGRDSISDRDDEKEQNAHGCREIGAGCAESLADPRGDFRQRGDATEIDEESEKAAGGSG